MFDYLPPQEKRSTLDTTTSQIVPENFNPIPPMYTSMANGALADRTKAGFTTDSFFKLDKQRKTILNINNLVEPNPADPSTWYYTGALTLPHNVKGTIPFIEVYTNDYGIANIDTPSYDQTNIYITGFASIPTTINFSLIISEFLTK